MKSSRYEGALEAPIYVESRYTSDDGFDTEYPFVDVEGNKSNKLVFNIC